MFYIPIIIKNYGQLTLKELLSDFISKKIDVENNLSNVFVLNKNYDGENRQYIGLDALKAYFKQLFLKHDTTKIYIILDADLLTDEAQNYLLKVLEEPNQNIAIFLVDNANNMKINLLATIQSRCLVYYLRGTDSSNDKSQNGDLDLLNPESYNFQLLYHQFINKITKIGRKPSLLECDDFFKHILTSQNTELLTTLFLIDLIISKKYNLE